MKKLRTVMDFCVHHQTVLGYSVVSLLPAASEHIFSAAVFKCPCNSWNALYGSVFVVVPAFILFLLGFMMNTRTWRLLTGCCPQDNYCSCNLKGNCTRCVLVLGPVAMSALVAHLTWIAVALLSASFYECAATGNSLVRKLMCKDKGEQCSKLLVQIPCDEKLSEKIPGELLSLRSQSQLIGWILIAFIVTLALISTCLSRCYSPVSFLQLKFWKIYLRKEQEFFETKAKEHATKLAERDVNCFFEAIDPTPFQTPSNAD
ncbi:calcium homeostasis modulator protein 6 [Struthio camelus]|uniref:calcium homeostasis modulator protein 6 n=1 Tax=Struthio camelus TaxID=8801 RepID=UPI003603F48D